MLRLFTARLVLAVLVKSSVAGKRLHGHSDSCKKSIFLMGVAYSFGGSVHHYDWEHGGMQADVRS